MKKPIKLALFVMFIYFSVTSAIGSFSVHLGCNDAFDFYGPSLPLEKKMEVRTRDSFMLVILTNQHIGSRVEAIHWLFPQHTEAVEYLPILTRTVVKVCFDTQEQLSRYVQDNLRLYEAKSFEPVLKDPNNLYKPALPMGSS